MQNTLPAMMWSAMRPVTEIGDRLLASTPLYGLGRFAEKLLALDRLDAAYASARGRGREFFPSLLDSLDIRYECPDEELHRVPAQGPVVLVCNHPFGLAEAPVIFSLLSRIRRDVKILANSLLSEVNDVREHLIPVDPFGNKGAAKINARPMRATIDWLRSGGLLVVFPAGEVASFQPPHFQITDPAWNDSIARVVRITGATVIPVFFHGTNSVGFHMAGLIHPRLRTALLPRELLNKRGRTLRVSVGDAIPAPQRPDFPHHEFCAHLRSRTERLQSRPEPIAPAGDPAEIRREIAQLTPLLSSGDYHVVIAEASCIPTALDEIGRLRELAFRPAGEGTGRARDLDSFDRHYRHLMIWNHQRGEIAGAYRIGLADEILERYGARGLYTNTLFKFDRQFLNKLRPGLELGRSFVCPEYQKDYLPLLLLWKGILRFVAQNPRYRLLFGGVSISNDYGSASRAMIVDYFKSRGDRDARMVRPRRKFHGQSTGTAKDLDELSARISDLEPDSKGVPVLLRQYANMGGTILEFNVDPQFSNALDGFLLVDLLNSDSRLLARYMGRESWAEFQAYHARGALVA